MLRWWEYALLPPDELAGVDLAVMNLACAEDLPGAEEIDRDYCLEKLDEWAGAVRTETFRLMPQFRRKPKEYENSEAYFRTLVLITVLQRDMDVRYNPAKIPDDAPFDTADSFIHGVIQGDGGTCATLPVVYAAVGRRLGYPIRLATTRGKQSGHLFCRWDDPKTGERFNIEATNQGLTILSDDNFRAGLYALSPEVESEGCHLRSLTPRMELGDFLSSRAWRWQDLKNWWKCVEAWAWSAALVPENVHKQNSLRWCMGKWNEEQERRKPVGFPGVLIRATCRQFPNTLPMDLEQNICGLTAVHFMLNEAEWEAKHWGPMRRGDYRRFPTQAVADFGEDYSCRVSLLFD